MRGHNVYSYGAIRKIIPKLSLLPLLIKSTDSCNYISSENAPSLINAPTHFSVAKSSAPDKQG